MYYYQFHCVGCICGLACLSWELLATVRWKCYSRTLKQCQRWHNLEPKINHRMGSWRSWSWQGANLELKLPHLYSIDKHCQCVGIYGQTKTFYKSYKSTEIPSISTQWRWQYLCVFKAFEDFWRIIWCFLKSKSYGMSQYSTIFVFQDLRTLKHRNFYVDADRFVHTRNSINRYICRNLLLHNNKRIL